MSRSELLVSVLLTSHPQSTLCNPFKPHRGRALQVAHVCEAAVACWWEDSHPGWMIFTLGNQHFETLDQIIQVRGRRLAGL